MKWANAIGKMVPNRFAWHGVSTNLQSVKTVVSAKHNKMRYAYTMFWRSCAILKRISMNQLWFNNLGQVTKPFIHFPHILFTYSFIHLFIFTATPATYGGSQARGWIGTASADLHHRHSNTDPSRVCDLHHSSWQHWILNPLSKASGRTHILMDPSQVC